MMVRWLLVVALFVSGFVAAAPGVTAQVGPPESCGGAELEWTGVDGVKPDASGGFTPVVLIHGITGSADMWRQWIEGSTIPSDMPVERATFEQVNRIRGAVAYTFDYHKDSLKWVDAPEVGNRFGEAIDCLYEWAGRPVVVVAHSMGGLVAKWVASTDGPLGARADEIGLVVTMGTPFEGSDVLAGGKAILDGGAIVGTLAGGPLVPVLRLLLLACGAAANVNADACGFFGVPDSDAGNALASGSDQLAALEPWPDRIEVVSLAGSIVVNNLVNLGIFYASGGWGSVDLGDIAVPKSSAVAGADRSQRWACDYTLNIAEAAKDDVLGAMGLKPLQEQDEFLGAFWNSPCYHSQLPTTIQIHNKMLYTINDYIRTNTPPVELRSGGLGPVDFESDGQHAIDYVTALVGGADSDTRYDFVPLTKPWKEYDYGDYYAYGDAPDFAYRSFVTPYLRETCWRDELCLILGSETGQEWVFMGWDYYVSQYDDEGNIQGTVSELGARTVEGISPGTSLGELVEMHPNIEVRQVETEVFEVTLPGWQRASGEFNTFLEEYYDADSIPASYFDPSLHLSGLMAGVQVSINIG